MPVVGMIGLGSMWTVGMCISIEYLFGYLNKRVPMESSCARSPGGTSRPLGLYGLGGVGKTGIGAECAYRYRYDYDLVWWVRFAQVTTDLLAPDAAWSVSRPGATA